MMASLFHSNSYRNHVKDINPRPSTIPILLKVKFLITRFIIKTHPQRYGESKAKLTKPQTAAFCYWRRMDNGKIDKRAEGARSPKKQGDYIAIGKGR